MSQAAGPRRTVIVDVETTSLIPDYQTGAGVIWELALLEPATGMERLYRIEPDVLLADPEALKVGWFAERTAGMRHATREEIQARYGPHYPGDDAATDVWHLHPWSDPLFWSDPADVARVLPGLLGGVTLLAANPAFDAGFMSALLSFYGQPLQPWNYRLRDIQSAAWGYLASSDNPGYSVLPPFDANTDDLARALGIDPAGFARHTAPGDCRLVEAMLSVITNGRLA